MIVPLRFAIVIALVLGTASADASAQTTLGDRELAMHALADMKAATNHIVRTEDGSAVGRKAYQTAALQARNALIGRKDRDFVASVGDPGDGVGAIGYIDRLLDRPSTPVWTDGLKGAKINLLAAAQSLTDSLHAKQMEDYQTDLTGAMADISLAIGRSSQGGVLGGIEGALATTSLGIPSGAKIVSGCSVPSAAPSYGVIAGTLAYLAVDRRTAAAEIPTEFPVRRIDVIGDRLVLYTSSATEIAKRCSHRVAVAPLTSRSNPRRSHRENIRSVASASLVSYTSAQAHAGSAVFAQNCVSCHGANLQGVAAPAVAGKAFVTQVTGDGWTVADLRNLVVQQMPLSAPGSLSTKQYADVMAYLLASNCYAAGSTPFPKTDDPKLAKVKIHPPHGATPNDTKLGTCRVR